MAAEVWEWIAADASVHRLDSNIEGMQIVGQVTGRGMPPIRRTADKVPLQPGSRKRAVVHDENEVTLGVYLSAATASGLRTVERSWMRLFDPTKGDGILRVTDPAGVQRELTCSYDDGLRLTEETAMRTDQLAVIAFVASDPYWSDAADSQNIWTAGAATTFFPIFPMRLGASQVLGTSTVINVGDVDTYPVWVVKGPAAGFTLSNLTTGRILQWGGTLGASEFVVVDCRPGNQSQLPKSVFKNDGTNVFGSLSQWDFWPFVPGGQTVDVEMAGATGGSQVTAIWRPRYLMA